MKHLKRTFPFLFALLVAPVCFAAAPSTPMNGRALSNFTDLQPAVPKEKELYALAIESYRSDDLQNLKRVSRRLNTYFPQSIYLDNAYYLSGVLSLKKGQLGDAVQIFDFVIKRFPKGNKRASAMYAKGIAYKKLNLTSPAKQYWKKVMSVYPGSLESQRAKIELRLMGMQRENRAGS